MRRLLSALLLALVAGLAALPGAAAARMLGDPSVPFSADRTLTVGDRSFTGKLYAIPGSQRHEQQIAGIDQVIILHGKDAHGWLLLPKLNSYVEFWFTPAAAELNSDDLLSAKLGEETVNGLRTTKYRIEHQARDGTLADGYVWLTREGIPMRLDGMYRPANGGKPTPVHMELSNVHQGPQDATLFAIPDNMMKLPGGALAPLLGLGKTGQSG
jgi:hypothetical protein